MISSEDIGAGDSNVLQDDKANVDGDLAAAEQAASLELNTPLPELSQQTPAPEPSAPSAEDLDLSVGNTAAFDYGRKLFNQLNELKTVYIEQITQLCNVYNKTSINDISVEDIKKCNKLQKKDLGELLLSILNKCSYLCYDSNLDNLSSFKYDTQFESLSSDLSKRIQSNLEKYSASQDARLRGIEEQIIKLNSYSEFVSRTPVQHSHQQLPPDHSPNQNVNHQQSANVQIINPALHIEDSTQDFVASELSTSVFDFLNGCDKFEQNTENGHSVAMFGQPYHYNGSRHPNQLTDIPSPISDVLAAIQSKYPNTELNSCLVNKYVGPRAYLPKHADNESTIDPVSSIYTVSFGHSSKVKFSETHGQEKHEFVANPNSLYVMSRASQAYWQHQIDANDELPEDSVRYSLTFRHVDKKFTKSTIIVGDSNTRNLKFGSGKGSFGHNMPGKREEAIHLKDLKPASCCGYRNIFVHCGINDLKHYRVNNSGKVQQKFTELKSKLEEITVLCPNSKLFVSPILPTKSQDWNQRAVHFNKILFDYCNDSNGKVVALNFSDFSDQYGNLRTDMGKYWNPSDPLHLGSKGITSLVQIIRQSVFNGNITSLPYSNVLSGHSVSNVHSGHVAVQSGPPRFAAT